MNSEFPIKTTGRPIAYVRPIKARDLPAEIRDQLPGVTDLYAIHHEEGERLALVTDRTMAFVMARQNDMEPVSVH
ncbi:DUF1150 family protein [Roseinatronobacter bogoriensis]|jgi:hypothetical protein|uniref:DUF1150 domain-containing protein n=1 Tax=Roseinatronobacter bogoriensis subsp. barguzinensis TaxID=441209 RepID=A0A2K8KCG1_9RHOB|nr:MULTISPECIES: DUF1150 family protein [Rhodobaca]ATX65395.1 DUF1150 domain-containing protein [Rhodobaca barguzinensis]MBB4208980.1 hypothetical protein [Rhodobaca bogoriensis DSM 18756]TDW37595.1 hypothetical protein LY39_02690 [Rhodobaca barguzinensis]TDY68205.1 hypothetical protein EV660_106111 [Rhodobaca bogoriensis DSM 18756]